MAGLDIQVLLRMIPGLHAACSEHFYRDSLRRAMEFLFGETPDGRGAI